MKSFADAWRRTEPEGRRFFLTLIVKIIAFLYWVRAISLSVLLLSSLMARSAAKVYDVDTMPGSLSPELSFLQLPLWFGEPYGSELLIVWQAVLMVVFLATGVGLYRFWNWGRVAAVALGSLNLAIPAAVLFVSLSNLDPLDIVGMGLGLIVQAAIVWFLLHSEVKPLFSKPRDPARPA